MKHLPLRECGYAIFFIVALVVLYGGAYLAMMQRIDLGELINSSRGSRAPRGATIAEPLLPSIPIATYRFGGDWSQTFFALAHQVDRQIRPELWQGEKP
jgi:hypothetical protein